MYLTKFMNANPSWREKLAANPYNLEIHQDGEYFILKYNMIMSDFNLFEVLEARGSIFRQTDNGEWICVCRALDKFGNYGESYAATNRIDWSQPVSVQEKIDGSIIKVWYDQGLWHVSSNGTIDAFKAECGDSTFGDVFYSIIEKFTTVRAFFDALDTHYCYFFEMVHPQYNHIVVHYSEPAIYFLGCRNMITMEENEYAPNELFYGIRTPSHFNYYSLAQCIEAAHNMGVDEEGYVVCAYNQMENNSFLRVKVKGDEYLRLHKMRGNGPLTVLRVVEMWQNDSLDDFIAYFPEVRQNVEKIVGELEKLINMGQEAYKSAISFSNSRKDFAIYTRQFLPIIQPYLFAQFDNKTTSVFHFYKEIYRARKIANWVSQNLHVTNIGVTEDE